MPLVIFVISEQLMAHIAFDLFTDVLFITDICLNFNTAFMDSSNRIVTSRRKIANRYLRTWLILDLVSSIPVQIIFLVDPSTSKIIFLKLFRLVKVLRLSRITRIRALRELQQNGTLHPSMVKLITTTCYLLFTPHLLLLLLLLADMQCSLRTT